MAETSIHEVKVFLAFRSAPTEWLSNGDLADRVDGVAPRTIRLHTLSLVKAGVVDVAEVFPGHRYRYASDAKKRNRGYHDRLMNAADVFGLSA